METVGKIFKYFFITLGVLFFLLIVFLVYFFTFDPLGLKPLWQSFAGTEFNMTKTTTTEEGDAIQETTISVTNESASKTPTEAEVAPAPNPALSTEQNQALETIGVDASTLPTSISPEQEQCFISILGEARVNEIKAGALPTAIEFFQARGCIE